MSLSSSLCQKKLRGDVLFVRCFNIIIIQRKWSLTQRKDTKLLLTVVVNFVRRPNYMTKGNGWGGETDHQ